MDGNSEEVGRECVCYGCGGVVRVCVCVYGGCEKVQDWSGDLASNESGVLPSERVNVGDREMDSERKRERECDCVA